MPAYVDQDAKVVCFFKAAAKFGVRYATVETTDAARLDEGEDLWPTEYAVTSTSDAVVTRLEQLVLRATGQG